MFRFELLGNDINTPIGWDEITFSLTRDPFYHGSSLVIDTSLTFIPSAGYEIILPYIESEDFDAELPLICFFNDVEIYRGDLNLYEYSKIGQQISVPIIETSFKETILNRQTLDVQIWDPSNVDQTRQLSGGVKKDHKFNFAPLPIFLFSILRKSDDFDIVGEVFDNATGQIATNYSSPFLNIIDDKIQRTQNGGQLVVQGTAGGAVTFDNREFLIPSEFYHIDTEFQNPSVQATYNVTLDMSGTLYLDSEKVFGWNPVALSFYIVYGDSTTTNTSLIYNWNLGSVSTGAGEFTQDYNINTTVPITLQANQKITAIALSLEGIKSTGGVTVDLYDIYFGSRNNDWNVNIDVNTEFPETQTRVCAISEAWNLLLESISGRFDVLRSDYYGRTNSSPTAFPANGCGSFRVICNGANIRGYDEVDDLLSEDYKPPTLNLQEFFTSMNAIDNIGLSIEQNKVRIESKDYFYNDTLLKDLGELQDVTFELITDLFYNEVNIGYEKWEDEINQGLYEFASQRQYTNKVKGNKAIYEQLSKVLASPFAIEKLRRLNKTLKPDSKTEYDEDLFIIQTDRSLDNNGQPNLTDPSTVNNPEVAGQKPTSVNEINGEYYYNVELSPVRNLLRHLTVLPKEWRYLSGKGSTTMESIVDDYGCTGLFDGNELREDESGLLGNLLYYPQKMTFQYPVCIEEFMEWVKNKYGYFQFTYCDRIYKGYILNLEYSYQDELATFELILKR